MKGQKMKNYKLFLIRQGSTRANEQGIYIGKADYGLSRHGQDELAEKLGKYEYPYAERVYSSPLRRCLETAEILYPEVDTFTVDELRETNLGDFEGKKLEDLVNNEDYQKWIKGGENVAPPNGETPNEVMERACQGINRILLDMMNSNVFNAAVITHAGIIIDIVTGLCIQKPDAKSLQVPFGEGFEIWTDAALWMRSRAFQLVGLVPYNRSKN